MATLYELTGALLELQGMLESGEYKEAELADTIDAVEGELEVKAEGYGKMIRNMESDAAALDAEIRRMQDRKWSIEKGVKTMRERLKAAMIATGKTKIKTDLFNFTVRKNGGKLPLFVDVDVSQLPAEMVEVIRKPNADAIRKYLDGMDPGATSPLAHYGTRGESLMMK